jgi:PAS domain S-box-containing protein
MAEVFCNALHNNEGAWVFAKASPLHDQSGNIIGAIESIRDITESKQAEEALQESEENFRHSLDDSPLGVRIVTAEGETIYANRAILDIYGFSSLEELRTTPLEKRYTSESYVEFKKRYERRQQGEDSPSEYEISIVRKNGEVRHLLVSRKGQLWNGEKQYQLLYRDITEPKQAEAQLRQSQKMEAIGTLAGGVAHDFNNLLTGILGNIALMRSSLPPADPLLENLNAAETSARQAADLTKGLLTFSRSAMVLPVPMNITAALDAALALLKQSLPATMEIVRDYDQTAWNVLMDQSQMTQILLNLAVNARDAMKGQGTLTIRARNEVVGEEYLQTHPFARTGEFVHLSVTDTGPGMSLEVMQHLFEPFYTTKPIGSGTGLGLSVVYGAVKQAGGWITAVSTEGVGRTAPQKHPSEAPLGSTPRKHPSDWENILGGIGRTSSGGLEEHPRGHWTNMFGGDLRYLPPSLHGRTQAVLCSRIHPCERRQRHCPGGRGRAGRAHGHSGSPEQERVYSPDSTGRGISPERPAGSPCGHRAHPAGHDHAGHDHRRSRAGHPCPGPNSPHPAELWVHLQRRHQVHARGG